MRELNMQEARALVTKAELDGLLTPPGSDSPVAPEAAEASPPHAGPSGDDDRRLIDQAFRHWEQTVRDLQHEVKQLRERVDFLERTSEATHPVKPIVPELPGPLAAGEPETPRLSRAERHRKSRWF